MRPRRLCAGLASAVLAVSLLALGLVAGGPSASADSQPRRIVNGWLPYWSMTKALASVTQSGDLWAEGSPLWYQVTGATAIAPHTGAGDATVVDALRSRGIQLVPTVAESLNAAGMAALLGDPGQRAAHVQALVGLVTANGYDGVDLDYESMNFGGTATDKATVRSGFTALAGELGAALHALKDDVHPQGRLLSVSVGPRTKADDPNWSVHDYAGLAPSVDRFRVMAYNYHWGGGPPGPIAPVWWVDQVLAYAVTPTRRSPTGTAPPRGGPTRRPRRCARSTAPPGSGRAWTWLAARSRRRTSPTPRPKACGTSSGTTTRTRRRRR